MKAESFLGKLANLFHRATDKTNITREQQEAAACASTSVSITKNSKEERKCVFLQMQFKRSGHTLCKDW